MTNYTDLIARLREFKYNLPSEVVQMRYDAADAIEALVKERDALKEQHHLRYRMWHDESIKRNELQHELAALRKQIDELQPIAWLYYERGEECFGHPDGYRPDDAVALYTLEGIKK